MTDIAESSAAVSETADYRKRKISYMASREGIAWVCRHKTAVLRKRVITNEHVHNAAFLSIFAQQFWEFGRKMLRRQMHGKGDRSSVS